MGQYAYGRFAPKNHKYEDNMPKPTRHWTRSKNINSKRYKRDLAAYLDGRALKCVTERINGIEEVVGKAGAIIKKDDELLIYSSQDVLMRTKIEWLYAWELMSLDGVVITAPDIEHGGEERTVIAFYSYWRQLDN
jgi:hypothetical protein